MFLETEASTPAGSVHLFDCDDVEVEEIEIFTTEYPYTHFGAVNNQAAGSTCRPEAAPERASNNAAGPVTGKANFTPAPASAAASYGTADPVPATPPRAAWTLSPANTESDNADTESSPSGDDEDTTIVLKPVSGNTAAEEFANKKPVTGAGRVQPRSRPAAIRQTRHTRRPGVLKRMLAWLGLAGSRN
jgi:hypothetical protein